MTKRTKRTDATYLVAATPAEAKVYQALLASAREAVKYGYAVIIWTPKELGIADPQHVEERSIELGWEIIRDLQ